VKKFEAKKIAGKADKQSAIDTNGETINRKTEKHLSCMYVLVSFFIIKVLCLVAGGFCQF